MDTHTRTIERLRQHSSRLSELLSETKLDAMEYATALQTLIQTEQEIRRLRIEDRYSRSTKKTTAIHSDDRPRHS
jgi:hypothetical protein